MTDVAHIEQSAEAVAIPENIADDETTIFSVPDEVADDPRWTRAYQEIVRRLQRETDGIPMTTVQYLLIERLASTFVILKKHEADGTLLPRQQKEMNAQFLAQGAEFNRLVQNNQENQRDELIGKIQKAVVAAINRVADVEIRKKMQGFLADEFMKAGL